jgi:hypothetical protein
LYRRRDCWQRAGQVRSQKLTFQRRRIRDAMVYIFGKDT